MHLGTRWHPGRGPTSSPTASIPRSPASGGPLPVRNACTENSDLPPVRGALGRRCRPCRRSVRASCFLGRVSRSSCFGTRDFSLRDRRARRRDREASRSPASSRTSHESGATKSSKDCRSTGSTTRDALAETHLAVCGIGTTAEAHFRGAGRGATVCGFATVVHPTARVPRVRHSRRGLDRERRSNRGNTAKLGRHVFLNRGALIGHHTTHRRLCVRHARVRHRRLLQHRARRRTWRSARSSSTASRSAPAQWSGRAPSSFATSRRALRSRESPHGS